MTYTHVVEPLRVGPLVFRNRIVMPAHTTNFGVDHLPSQRHIDYHAARARGGVGAIIFESIRVHQNSLGRPQAVCGFDPACIAPFRKLTQAVKAEGAAILGQIIHLGRQVEGDFERTVSWGASPLPWSTVALPPRPMDERDMQEVIDGHVRTARNLVEAGFDGIELQMAHGHLLQQFLSPLSNKRRDAYGGTMENRLRFPLRVLQAVRAAVGPEYCLGLRLGADEYIEGGLEIAEVERMLPLILAAARVDFVNVSHSAYHGSASLATQMADMAIDPTPFRELPKRLRRVIRDLGLAVPVFAVCRFNGLDAAEASLASGEADAIAIARGHLADPDLVRKSLAGRAETIRGCISCNQGCAGMLERNLPLRCLVNPLAGIEGDWPEPEEDPAPRPGRVLVVGGGPAGIEAARVSAARGHQVTLWEADGQLGGQLTLAAKMPLRENFAAFTGAQIAALGRLGVTVVLNRRATAREIADFGADMVYLAIGSDPVRGSLPQSDRPVLTLAEALAAPEALGPRIALFDRTGEWGALSAVEMLATLGHKVMWISPITGFAWRTTIYSTLANMRRLRGLKVKLKPLHLPKALQGDQLTLEDLSTGETEVFGCDTLIMVEHNHADQGLLAELRALAVPLRQIGDNNAPRTAVEAVYQGHMAARQDFEILTAGGHPA